MWKETEDSLYRKFVFDSFSAALDFINTVGQIAVEHNHHPKIINSYKTVEIELSTHSEGNRVTDKDKNFAKKLDQAMSVGPAKLFTDGGSRGNPGPSATGFAIIDTNGNIIKKDGEYIGITTNNQAEYQALIKGLGVAARLGIKDLSVFMDSELIIKQINGQYKVKNADLRPQFLKVKKLSGSFGKITFSHVLRAKNSIADSLVNDALDNQK